MNNKKILTELHRLIANYNMPYVAKKIIGSGEVAILCGVTASGKNTIANYLISHGNYEHVVSHTTRPKRENHGILETSGNEYWFVTPGEMLELVKEQKFIEVKAVHGDTCYGTSIKAVEDVLKKGSHPVMEIDVQGVLELTHVVPNIRPLFILPPSYEVWMERLGMRGNISDGDKYRRLRSASMEIQTALDHKNIILVVNHEVEITASEIIQGIDTSQSTQDKYADLARDLMESIKNI